MSFDITLGAGDSSCPYTVSTIPAVVALIKNGTIWGEPGISSNFQEFVAECPDVCGLLLGTGNPDLTGIGLFVHYNIQAVLTAVLLGVPSLFSPFLTRHPRLSNTISKFRRIFLEFNAYTALAIVVSCFVRFCQYASAYELAVVQAVINFEAFVIMICLFHYPATDWLDLNDTDAPWSKQMVYLIFFLLAAIANVVMGTSLTYNGTNSQHVQNIGGIYLSMFGLLDTCSYGGQSTNYDQAGQQLKIQSLDLFSVFVPIVASAYLFCRFISRKQVFERWKKSTLWRRLPIMPPHIRAVLKWMIAFITPLDLMGWLPFYATPCVVPAIIFLWVFDYMAKDNGNLRAPKIWFKRCRQFCETCWDRLCQLKFLSWLEKPQNRRLVLWSWPVVFFSGLYPALKLFAIQACRSVLAEALETNAENYWGVGQVAALLAWLPLLVEAAAELVRFSTSLRRKRTANISPSTKSSPHMTPSLTLSAQSTGVYLQSTSFDQSASIPLVSSQHIASDTLLESPAAVVTHDLARASESASTQDRGVYTIHRTGTSSSMSFPEADRRSKMHKRSTLTVEEGIHDS